MRGLLRRLFGRREPQWVIPEQELKRIRRRVAMTREEEKSDRARFNLNIQPE